MPENDITLKVFSAEHLTVSDEIELFVVVNACGENGVEHKIKYGPNVTAETVVKKAAVATSTTLPPEALKEAAIQVEHVITKATFISELTLRIGPFSITIKKCPKDTHRKIGVPGYRRRGRV
jgi:hypothetical protein